MTQQEVAAPTTPKHPRARFLWFAASVGVLLVVVFLSLALGARSIDLGSVIDAIFAPVTGNVDHTVVRDQRVPRTIIGIVAGAALALAGTIMQGLTRNPLADPGLLGVNAGASLFVVIGLTFFGVSHSFGQIWFAFAGAMAATVLVYVVSAGKGGPTPITLTLAGAAVTAAITSVITLLLLGNLDTLNQYRFWAVGSLVGRGLDSLLALIPFLLIGLVLALVLGPMLNVMSLGDDVARGLGQSVPRARVLSAIAVVLLCGCATALAGPIVFVGLVVPHIVRRITGPDYRWLLALALVVGPILLVTADIIGRLIVLPGELEAGLVVAFVGAPLMIAIVRSRRLGAL